MTHSNIIIITDLDGTLLDHDTYSFEPAVPALEQINNLHIPLILSSSKTAEEIIQIRKEMENKAPFVVENGAGIFLPDVEDDDNYEEIKFAESRDKILEVLKKICKDFNLPFTGFYDISIQELMALTNLTQNEAILAKKRNFTEPLKWDGSATQWKLFCTEIERAGLIATSGGRFISVSSQVNKGKALSWLRQYYQQIEDNSVTVIASGDSENDREMLELADYSILVRSSAHDLPEINANKLIITKEIGPLGWNNSIIELLEKFNL